MGAEPGRHNLLPEGDPTGRRIMIGTERQFGTRGFLDGRREFFVHLVVYCLVGTMLVVLSRETSPDYFWAKWPLMGWGIGVLVHALNVFVLRR